MIWIVLIGVAAIIIGFGAFFGAPYLPSKRKEIRMMFEQLYTLTAHDRVLDIGCGDGVVLREVSRRGARALGIEINPFFASLAGFLSRRDKRVEVQLGNFWMTSFPDDITVVYAFSVGRDGKRLERKMQQETDRLLKPLTLICLGNPLPYKVSVATFRAYARYDFRPLHSPKAQV